MTDGPDNGQSATGPAARAADPNTPQVQLHMLAGDHPELRPLIAENPNTYPELLEWLAGLNDPAVNAALARRAGGGGVDPAEQNTTMLPATDPAPRGGTEEFSAVRQDRPADYQQPGQPAPYDAGYPQDYADPQPRAGYYPSAPAQGAPWQAPHPAASYPAGAYPAGAYPVEREEEPRRRSGGTCAIIFLIILLAVAAVVAAYFLIFGGVFGGNDDADQDTVSQGEVQGEQEQAPEEEPDVQESSPAEEDPSAEENQQEGTTRPAPEGAQDIPAFTAPSGNINCAMDAEELSCSILDYSFENPEDCAGPARFSLAAEEAQLGCGSTDGAASATLQYGQSASNGRFACVSSESGFECWNTETGNGFFMARQSYQLQD